MRWPVDIQYSLRKKVARHAPSNEVSADSNMMARFVNAARRGDSANATDAIDELLTVIEIMDCDPAYMTCGIAARVEAALLLSRHGRIAEAEATLDRPKLLILDQIQGNPEARERAYIDASLLFNGAGYVDIQAARWALGRAIWSWLLAGLFLRSNMPDLAYSLLSHLGEQLLIAEARPNAAVIHSKVAWNHAKSAARSDLLAFATERLETALSATNEQAAAALVAERRAQIGEPPRKQWIIDPETWRLQ